MKPKFQKELFIVHWPPIENRIECADSFESVFDVAISCLQMSLTHYNFFNRAKVDDFEKN